MTDREKAIVMAYTSVTMLTGVKLDLFYQYIAEIIGRPVFTHKLATQEMTDKIKEKSKPDFIKLCRETTEPIVHAHWVKTIYGDFMCSYCHIPNCAEGDFCSWCGAKMDENIDD